MISPCVRCKKVPDPRQCLDKECPLWRNWFLGQWEGMRRQVRQNYHAAPVQPEGVNIGGVHYAPPHWARKYLDTDPCGECKCPKEVCLVPCGRKQRWVQAREEVYMS